MQSRGMKRAVAAAVIAPAVALGPVVAAAAIVTPPSQGVVARTAPTTTPPTTAPSQDNGGGPSDPASGSPSANTSDDPGEPVTSEPECDRTKVQVAGYATDPLWQEKALDLEQAQKYATGSGIKVAVLDTGVMPWNPLMENVKYDETSSHDFVGTIDNATVPCDADSHGTMVAAIIAARRNDELSSFYGVAPDVELMIVRVLFSSDGQGNPVNSGQRDLAEGIDHAVNQGADIINASIESDSDNPRLEEAVAHAYREGVLIVAAAGNHGAQSKAFPARYAAKYPNVISVGAVDQQAVRPDFSGASSVTVMAPGKDIISVNRVRGTASDNGTSFAAPFVTGVAALIMERYKDATPSEVRRRIELSASPAAGESVPSKEYGYGILDPVQALTGVYPDLTLAKKTTKQEPVAPFKDPPPPDTTMRDLALSITFGAIAIVVGVLAGVVTVRRGRQRGWRPG